MDDPKTETETKPTETADPTAQQMAEAYQTGAARLLAFEEELVALQKKHDVKVAAFVATSVSNLLISQVMSNVEDPAEAGTYAASMGGALFTLLDSKGIHQMADAFAFGRAHAVGLLTSARAPELVDSQKSGPFKVIEGGAK